MASSSLVRSFRAALSRRVFVAGPSIRNNSSLTDILRQVETGKLGADDAASMILKQPTASPDDTLQSFANLDHSRANRTGFPEAIFAQSKTSAQVAAILDDMALNVNKQLQDGIHSSTTAGTAILATRVTPEQYEEVSKIGLKNGTIEYHEVAQIISVKASGLEGSATSTSASLMGTQTKVVVACAGTTDLPVAEEAAITLEAAGCEVTRVYDAGVAGLHRIINALPKLRDPQVGCVIVCAGMDGALPSVVGGLVEVPVIAVPTSIGYGASFHGISAMLTMLNSCAPGVGVVNIDNGFGAAALAFKCINRKFESSIVV